MELTKQNAGLRTPIRTLRIIEHVAASSTGRSLAQLSAALASPKSSLHGLLQSLCVHGYLIQAEGRYLIGAAATRLGLAIAPSASLIWTAKLIMCELMEESGETVMIAVLDRDALRATYVEMVESSNPIRYTVPLGTSRPLYCSAAGRVLLAFQPSAVIDSYFAEVPLKHLTRRTQTNVAELRRRLALIQDGAVSVTSGEVSDDVAGFAAPLFDQQRNVVAALVIGAPVSRAELAADKLIAAVSAAAHRISLGLGMPA